MAGGPPATQAELRNGTLNISLACEALRAGRAKQNPHPMEAIGCGVGWSASSMSADIISQSPAKTSEPAHTAPSANSRSEVAKFSISKIE